MKMAEVTVPWKSGLHARPAARVVTMARSFTSTITLKCNQQMANARSILGVMLLCATLGSTIQVQVEGEDEDRAIEAVQQVFASPE